MPTEISTSNSAHTSSDNDSHQPIWCQYCSTPTTSANTNTNTNTNTETETGTNTYTCQLHDQHHQPKYGRIGFASYTRTTNRFPLAHLLVSSSSSCSERRRTRSAATTRTTTS